MADVESFLTRKVGPLPVWAYAAGGGVLAGVFVLYRRGAAAQQPGAPGAQGAPGTGPYAPSPIVITTPSTMPDQVSSANPQTPPTTQAPPTPTWQFGFGMPSARNQWVWHVTAGAQVPNFPPGQVYPASTSDPSKFNLPPYSWQWAMVPSGYTDLSYAQALNQAGLGGGSSAVRHLEGGGKVGRFRSPHAHPQYVKVAGFGFGGGGLGAASRTRSAPPARAARGGRVAPSPALRSVQQQSGLPMIRLMALNPGQWRPGSAQSGDTLFIQ